MLILPIPSPGLKWIAAQVFNDVSNAISVVSDAVTWASRVPLIAETAFVSKRQLTTISDRIAAVARIVISPSKYVLYEDVSMIFTGIGYDQLGPAGEIVQGVPYTWSVSDSSKATIDPSSGRINPLRPGLVWVTGQAGAVHAMAPVLIRPGHKPAQTDADYEADQASLRDDGSTSGSGGGGIASLLEQLAPTAYAQSGGGDIAFDQLVTTPGNLVGTPRDVITDQTALGPALPESSNFELAIPIASLGGRGITANLTLYLNSQTWATQGSSVYFNPIQGWPAPGFSLGMGRIVVYGSSPNQSLMLVDPDGTRHKLAFVSSNLYATTDGTHINFNGSPAAGGTLYYPDGTNASYFSAGSSLLPNQITDTNGNFVAFTYDANKRLSAKVDTKNRVISFGLDANGNLSSITGPGPNGATITLMQFDYMPMSLNFNNTMPVVNATQGQALAVLRHVYNPATNTGYLFNYSGYGVVTTVSKRRQMSVTGGAISDGVESANATFGYPAGGTQITGVPTYSTWTQTPGSANAFFFGLFGNNALGPNTVTYREIPPDYQNNLSSYPITFYTRSTDTTSPGYGLLTRLDIQDAYGNQYRKVLYNYALDPGGSPQVQSITTYDETNTPTMVNFDYDSYGNITNKREFGYQVSGVFQVRRRTHTTYLTGAGYIAAYMLNRPTEVDLYDALLNTNDVDDVLIAKKTFAYDQYTGGMMDYGQSSTPGHLGSYDKNFTLRANVTGTTTWTDLGANTSITRTASYDIFGNVVSQQVSCCQQKSYTFGSGDYYTNPTQMTSGAGPSVTDTMGWDFNTDSQTSFSSLAKGTTGAVYDNAFRVTSITVSPNGSKIFSYNDATMSVSMTVNAGPGSGLSQSFDGWGRVVTAVDQGGGQVFSTYDPFGRLASKTNPLPSGSTTGPTTAYQYDPLGRVVTRTLPDGSTIGTNYSGGAVTVTDEVGRKAQRQFDGLGRLAAVTEQDPGSGSLSQTTNYSYDLLNNLTQVNQGGQTRSWKYDATGRMLYENIPEQSATINDGTGTMWTCKWAYNNFGLVTSKTDARGVVFSYGYNGLNKLTSINYNTSNASGVATTLPVNISYDSAGRINSGTIGTAPVQCPPPPNNCSGGGSDFYYAESYTYDGSANPGLTTLTRTIDTLNPADGTLVSGQSYTTSYANDSFRNHISITYPSGRTVSYNRQSNALRLASVTDQNATYLNNISYNAAGLIWQFNLGNGVTEGFGYDNASVGTTGNRLQMTAQLATSPGGASGNLMTLTYGYQASAGQSGTGTTAGNAGQLTGVAGTINGQTESAAYSYDDLGRLVTSSQTSNGASAQRRFSYDRWGNRTGEWDATSGGNQLQNITIQQPGGAPTNALATISSAGESVFNTPGQCGTPTTVNVGRTGRYVRVQLMAGQYLHLAEVQVIGTSGQNLALGKPSTQSSTAFGGAANRANDGNTDGNFADGSVSHTDFQWLPWWQVDLGSSQQITSINVWNRTDCCSWRTSNFNVIVSDQPIATTTYIYDGGGNVFYDGVHTYQYDAENRLVRVDAGATAQYFYDFKNRRVKKVTAAGTTHYVWDGGTVLSEHNGSTASVLVDYIYSGATLIAKVANGVTNYLISDRLSVRLTLDASGNVAGQQTHGPFGEEFGESGQQDKHHFTSYESDPETGTDYALNRFYSVSMARFMSADPYKESGYLVDPQSWNRYAYARNNPIDRIDPAGLHDGNWSDGKGNGGPWDCVNCGGNDISPDYSNDVAGTGAGGNKHGPLADTQNPPTLPIFIDPAEVARIRQMRDNFKSFLNTMSDDCKAALAAALDALRSAIDRVNFYDLDYRGFGNRSASDWIGNNLTPASANPLPNETLNAWFGRIGHDAATVFGRTVPFGGGIFFHGGQGDLSGYLLLHEMLHYVYQRDDQGLALLLGVAPKPAEGGRPAETFDQAVSRYINSGCDPREK